MTDPVARLNAALEGRYAIERELGEGGMATVYLAKDLKHNRSVALKVLKPELAAVVGAERFLAEIETTANLTHPHILPLFDSGEADSFLFYVMPYVEGETLRERIDREKQLPVDEAVRIATNVAEALDYAHSQGTIHRDIKPANILLQAGKPVISDFGIALAVGVAGGGRLTETGLSVGTPHYMSPEQATGDQAVGVATDIYALGAVLYEMLVGEPPYTGSTAQAILGKIIQGKTASATEERASVPANVDAAIRKALEKLPADRFAGAVDLSKALGDPGFRHGEVDAGRGQGHGQSLWNPLSITTSVLALTFASSLGWMATRPEPSLPVITFRLSLPAGFETDPLPGSHLAISPDGSTIVFVAAADGRSGLWLRRLDQLSAELIPDTEGGLSPRFSPDGQEVVFTADTEMKIVSLSGAPPRSLRTNSNAVNGLAWGEERKIYFSDLQGISRMSPEGGEAERVTEIAAGELTHRWPEVLPGGRGLLFARGTAGAREDITVLSFETGEIRSLLQGTRPLYAATGHIIYATNDGLLLVAPFDIKSLEVTGTPRRIAEGIQIGGDANGQFALSASGSLVYRLGSGLGFNGGRPAWIEADGSLVPLDPGAGGFSAPAISPSGRKIAFEHVPPGGAQDIWVFDLDRGALERLTFEGQNWRPFWSPDGDEIGFFANRDGFVRMYARAADFGGSERLLRQPDEDGRPPREALWTPDGRGIVYRVGNPPASRDILYAPAHPDSAAEVLVGTAFAEQEPSLSPNGRWLAYASVESGSYQVYVRPFGGTGPRVPVSTSGGRSPVWARDGNGIFYQTLDGTLVVASVRTDPDFEVESREETEWPRPFFGSPTQNFDSSPDGRLLVIEPPETLDAEARDVVVVNFFEELTRLVPN
jgi:serine/threonine-protein kinase